MKYKLELWKYDMFDGEAVEKHLNDMAQRGLELIHVTFEWVPLAIYRRDPSAADKRFAVEMVSKGDEAQFKLYHDGGWEKVAHLRNCQCIFAAKNEQARPLFTDQITKYQNAAEVVQKSDELGMAMFGLVVVAMIAAYCLWKAFEYDVPRHLLYCVLALAGILIISGADFLGNYHFTKRKAACIIEGVSIEKPMILKVLHQLNFYTGAVLLAALFLYVLIKYVVMEAHPWVLLLLLSIPVLFLTGYFMRVVLKKTVLGFFLMAFGAVIFYGGFSLILQDIF